jgi:hypothetical protein
VSVLDVLKRKGLGGGGFWWGIGNYGVMGSRCELNCPARWHAVTEFLAATIQEGYRCVK